MIPYPPQWLANMHNQFPEEFPGLLEALQQPSQAGLRINPLRANAAVKALDIYGGEPVPWYARYGRYVRCGHPAGDVAHFAGGYYMQDPSAMSAVAVLQPKPGERILDLCAAPGGKSGQIAAELCGKGVLISNEIDSSRAKMLSGNMERLGVANVSVVSAAPDALAEKWAGLFDAVLCDAPCSGEGMFRRDPSARTQWTERSPEGCAARQRTILSSAVRLLRPGGRLVYSTCTFNLHENEENVEWLLSVFPEMQSGSFSLPGIGESHQGCLRLWPHKIQGEGHFISLLRKTEASTPQKQNRNRKMARPVASGEAYLSDLTAETNIDFGRFAGWKPEVYGDRLFLVPPEMPDTEGLFCLRRGLPVARIGRSHIEPEHALAMALLPEEPGEVCSISGDQIAQWLSGMSLETGKVSRRRWIWMHTDGLPLGWGKAVDGMIKNHLPKGLWKR